MAILSVTQLNRYVGFKLKEDRALQSVLVRGEITNFTNHYRSGHLYFTLRDAESCVKAVMFRSHAQRLKFLPQEGMNVIAAASAALYERDGAFQIYVTDLQPDGTGGKALALEQLKKKLTAMGVFDAASKRPLPAMPKKIGVITSDTGAALQDVKNVIGRRYPIGHLLVYPAQVQGDAAAASVCRAIAAAERRKRWRRSIRNRWSWRFTTVPCRWFLPWGMKPTGHWQMRRQTCGHRLRRQRQNWQSLMCGRCYSRYRTAPAGWKTPCSSSSGRKHRNWNDCKTG